MISWCTVFSLWYYLFVFHILLVIFKTTYRYILNRLNWYKIRRPRMRTGQVCLSILYYYRTAWWHVPGYVYCSWIEGVGIFLSAVYGIYWESSLKWAMQVLAVLRWSLVVITVNVGWQTCWNSALPCRLWSAIYICIYLYDTVIMGDNLIVYSC